MNSQNDDPTNPGDSDSIYRAPTSDTNFAPQGDMLASYVGPKNSDYYLERFERFRRGDGAVSWHWPAFFVSSVWLLYRKMWFNAFAYWILLPTALFTVAVVVGSTAGQMASVVTYYASYAVIAFLLVPMFANRLYYRHAQAKVGKVAATAASADAQSEELARIGGTSNIALVVVPVVLVVILGMLAAISIPAYQDYTIRAQVSEGLNLAGGAKVAVTEHFQETGELAASNRVAGLEPAERISSAYVSSVAVEGGEIVITYGNLAHETIDGRSIVLMPDVDADDGLYWTCASVTVEPRHLPAACR